MYLGTTYLLEKEVVSGSESEGEGNERKKQSEWKKQTFDNLRSLYHNLNNYDV